MRLPACEGWTRLVDEPNDIYATNRSRIHGWLARMHGRVRDKPPLFRRYDNPCPAQPLPRFFFYQSSFDFVHVPTIYSNWFSLLIHGRIGYFPPILFDNGNLWKIVNIVTRIKKQSNYFIANFYLLEKVIQKWLYQNLIKISE